MLFHRLLRQTGRQKNFSSSFLGELRWGDMLLLLGLAVLSFYAWHWNRAAEGSRLIVEITQEGQRSLYPLDKEQDLVLRNSTNKQVMLVKFQDRRVWSHESNCPLQYCVLRGKIGDVGQWIACLPNKIFIRILAAKKGADLRGPFALDASVS